MNSKLKLLAVAAFVLIASLSSAFADEYAGRKHGMQKCERAKMEEKADLEGKFYHKASYILEHYKELELSDDQANKIKELKYKAKRSAVLKDAEVKALALDIKQALGKEEVKPAAINTLIDKKFEIKKEKAKEFVAAYLELRALLSKDQHKKLIGLWQEHVKEGDKE